MSPARQRQWKSQSQQQALIEYGLLRHACPEGIYLSLTPGNFALWSGVLFVRKGPYSPAVLRFQVAFPQRYPDVPPLVLFTSEVFHPLITPLTTYTYTTGSSATDPVSATDEDRLLPGGFSLRHGFPRWFERGERLSPAAPMFPDIKRPTGPNQDDLCDSDDHQPTRKTSAPRLQPTHSFHIPPPKDDGEPSHVDDLSPSIVEVLGYLRNVFEDEALLDDLPLDAAGNPGAWHAWRAHRRKGRPAVKAADAATPQSSTPHRRMGSLERMAATPQPSTPHRRMDSTGKIKPANDWNWDGVWAERVKRGVNASLSEAMLYGGVDGDDLIHFLDLDEETIETIRSQISGVKRPEVEHLEISQA